MMDMQLHLISEGQTERFAFFVEEMLRMELSMNS
jgi:hypothetical protein